MYPRINKAVFPVAGFGTRFLPATKAMPKEDPAFDAQMAVAEDIMREDRDILRKLAK